MQMAFGIEETAQYRGFNLYGGCEPTSKTLLGRVTQWKPTRCIAHKHRTEWSQSWCDFTFPWSAITRRSLSVLDWRLPGCCLTQASAIFRSPVWKWKADAETNYFSEVPGMDAGGRRAPPHFSDERI